MKKGPIFISKTWPAAAALAAETLIIEDEGVEETFVIIVRKDFLRGEWEEGVEGDHHQVGEGQTEEAVEAAEGAEDEYEFNRILHNRNEKYTSLVTMPNLV